MRAVHHKIGGGCQRASILSRVVVAANERSSVRICSPQLVQNAYKGKARYDRAMSNRRRYATGKELRATAVSNGAWRVWLTREDPYRANRAACRIQNHGTMQNSVKAYRGTFDTYSRWCCKVSNRRGACVG